MPTALAAASLRRAASRRVGVDISPRMLEKAREKGLYDELVEMELGDFLKANKATFDLIVASDVLNALLPGGRLAFNAESGDDDHGFALGPHGRYSHGKDYIMDTLRQAGLQLQQAQETVLRQEFGKEVKAFLLVATKA